jgi:hypothetical protein
MVMVLFCLAEFIFNGCAINDFKDNAQGFEEIKRTVDGGQSNLSLLFKKSLVDFLRTQRGFGIRELLIN